MIDESKIKEWFLKNMRTHTDWTGTYVEYNQNCDSVEELYKDFMDYIKR